MSERSQRSAAASRGSRAHSSSQLRRRAGIRIRDIDDPDVEAEITVLGSDGSVQNSLVWSQRRAAQAASASDSNAQQQRAATRGSNAQQPAGGPAPRRSRAGPAPPVAPGSGSNGAATTRQRRQGRAVREAAAQPGWFWLKNKAPAALLLSAARLKRAHTAPDGDCQFAAAVQADAALQGYHLSAPQLRSKTAELRRKVAIALRTNEAVRKLVLADGADPDALALRIERMAYSASDVASWGGGMALRVTAIVLECSIVTVNDNDPPNVGLYSASAARPDVGWWWFPAENLPVHPFGSYPRELFSPRTIVLHHDGSAGSTGTHFTAMLATEPARTEEALLTAAAAAKILVADEFVC